MEKNNTRAENKSIILKTSPPIINMPFSNKSAVQKMLNWIKTFIPNTSIKKAIAEVKSIAPNNLSII